MNETKSFLRWREIPGGVWALGFVSLLMDISSEMIHALLPLYLVTVLGTSMLTVGVIEGIAEATTSIVKIFSGALSDWLGKRKLLAALGYGLAALPNRRSHWRPRSPGLSRLVLLIALAKASAARRAMPLSPTSVLPKSAERRLGCVSRSIRWAQRSVPFSPSP
jgi:Na+/melibiose symporter-like transporter